MRRFLVLLALSLAACATPESAGRKNDQDAVTPDDAKPTANADALAGLQLCRSKLDEVTAKLGKPYREGLAHNVRVYTWKLSPGGNRKPEPIAIAFNAEGIMVDWCYDLPGLVGCELSDICWGRH